MRRLLACAPDTFTLHGVIGLPNTRRVEHGYGKAAEIEMKLEHISGCSGKRRDDRRLAARKPIEQRRLPCIGRTGNGHA